MKVIRPGLVVFHDRYLLVRGWTFDAEGAPMPTDKDVTRCALDYIAKEMGVPAAADATEIAVSFDAERLTAEVLARAARPAETAPWWQVWKRRAT